MIEGKTKSTPKPSKPSSPSNRIYLKHRPPRSTNDITDNDTKKFDSDASIEEIIELLQNFSFDEAKQLKLTRIENIKLKGILLRQVLKNLKKCVRKVAQLLMWLNTRVSLVPNSNRLHYEFDGYIYH
ncbi:hypothetical protein GCK72_023956 [Caenorhabditis remanei]|uniref:Uncharacterized protein n=1 Tax=Caenorhabditis remanei TaxID=31234 RepID=A0A6A5FYA2_CAERE|nr:hypothetical protein GCK72_023956 [Caenorhabditis remanei]KAF1747492.1 hypothetical protein GCK72_023956 [Caenorhabditis remanei]